MAELTVQGRVDNIARWVKLTEEGIGASCTNSAKPGPKGAVRAAERELGIEHTRALRAIKIGSIAPEAKQAARDVGLDNNQSVLLRAAKESTPAAQVTVLLEIAERRAANPPLTAA